MPERARTTADVVEGPEVRLTRERRLFLDGGRIVGLRIAGEDMPAHIAERVTSGTLTMSTSAQAELALTFVDAGYGLLDERRLTLGVQVDYAGLTFRVAAIEAGGDGLKVTCRDAAWKALRHAPGAEFEKDSSPTEYFARRCRKLGLGFVGEPSPKRRQSGRQGKETTAGALARYATELGYIVFAAAGTVYFGRPTWLATQGARILVAPGDRFLRNPWPTVRATDDDPRNSGTLTLEVEPELGDRLRPGMVVELAGVPYFDGLTYLVDSVTIPLDAVAAVAVSASTPVNPEPQPPGAAGSAATAAEGGGSKRVGDLLESVGFTGNGLRIATGVVIAESGADAHARGDVDLVDAKWGPSIGLFQIRSLKRPQDYSGDDRLRVADELLDAVYNARTAYKISNGGASWGAWSTFTSGAYATYQGAGNTVIKNWDGLPAPAGSAAGGSGGSRAGMVWPTPDRTVNTPYKQPGSWAAGYHTGVDLGAAYNAQIRSAHSGRVVFAGPNGDYGNTVTIRVEGHDVMYCHLLSVGTVVGRDHKAGDPIGHADTTGRSFGNHLHFEVRPAGASYGNEVDPMDWLP